MVNQDVSMQEFVDKWLNRTPFGIGRFEAMARKSLADSPSEPLRVIIGETCFRIFPAFIAIYFGLASPLPEASAPAPEPVPEAEEAEEVVEEEGGEDEAHVSSDPIGLDDVPPESAVRKRRPGRPKKG